MSTAILVRTDRGEERLDLDEFEARVARGEIAPQCPVQFPPVTGEAWVSAGSLEIFRQRYSRRELRFAQSFRLGGIPRVTLAFCLVNIAWYAVMQVWPSGSTDDTLLAYGAKAGPLLLDLGQFWRLLSANFVHRDLIHIGMNLFVLFNFAGALENAFRPVDMAVILLASLLGTTVLSALVTNPISAGASGVAYGALGAAVVFGIKYRPLLPERYRRLLGGAVIPTVAVFFFLGFTSTGVDNWGHLGGFLAGSAATLFLRPRLLADPATPAQLWLTRGVPMLGSVALVLLAGPLTRPFLPALELRRDPELGVVVRLPAEWETGASELGGHTYLNGLPGYGEAKLTVAGGLADEDPDVAGVLDEVIQRGLWGPETEQELHVRHLAPVSGAALADGTLKGLAREAVFEREGLEFDYLAMAVHRGRLVVLIEAISSSAQPGYSALLRRAIAELKAEEPLFLRQARARRLFLPASEDAAEGLAEASEQAAVR